MGNITVSLDEETERKLRRLAKEKFGGGKGSMAKAIKEGIEQQAKKTEKEEAVQRLLARMKKGYHLGGIQIKHRSELYDR